MSINYGTIVAYSHVAGTFAPALAPLFLGSVCWTIYYDSIYAYQDRLDDITAGVKSTALAWQGSGKKYLTGFSGSAIALWTLAGYMTGLGTGFYVGMLGISSNFIYQISTVDLEDPQDCWNKFSSAKYTGLFLLASIILGKQF